MRNRSSCNQTVLASHRELKSYHDDVDITESCSLIHEVEAEQKIATQRTWRREDGRIENLVKGRARSRGGWDLGR